MAKKTWIEKRILDRAPVVEVVEKKFADIPAGASMLIANPLIVDGYVRQIPKGHGTDISQMRKDLAAEYGAQYMCPVTAGIFLRIVAEAAWEELQHGAKPNRVTPFWRIVSLKSPTAKKLSFGTEFLQQMRQKEKLDN